ncbi:AAA family ATPase [Limnobacter litoralis]|uniref:Fimbrial protein n=1 Tax=Limnobacter litoralis TaxID=481366 RepID=A0ABQ5YSV0_9BURK|nr:hypothetical protein [Limnobacter litoralis]GLR26875.1 fimbrial protein [Limnobacter litoralis]
MQSIARILVISGSDPHWLWLSDAVGERYMLVRETGTFSEIAQRVGLVSPTLAVVDFSPQAGVDPALIVRELSEISPDLPVIAMGTKSETDAVVRALRSGVRDFLDTSTSPGEVLKIVSEVLDKAPAPTDDGKGHVIVVLGARQGVGATTLAVNIASRLSKGSKEETLLLDFGLPLGDGLIHLPCDEKQGAMNFVECVRNVRRFDATLAKTAFRRHSETGMALLSLPRNLTELRDVPATDALKFLNLIKSFFENIVIDLCGFSNLEFVANLLRSADKILLVTPQSVPGIVTGAELIKSLNDKGIAASAFDLVISPHHKETALTPEAIAQKLSIERVYTLPDRNQALVNAVNEGRVLSTLDPKDPYSKAVEKLLSSIHQQRKEKLGAEQGGSLTTTLKKWFVR